MGRMTVPFRVKFEEKIGELRRLFQEVLMDFRRRDAFNELIKAWSDELHAMSYLNLPTMMEAMLLTAVVDNRREIELIKRKIDELRVLLEGIRKHQDEG